MKKRNLLIALVVTVLAASFITGCGNKEAVATNDGIESKENNEVNEPAESDITIVYTNDVHSYIDNTITDKDGNVTGDGLRFSKVAAMVKDLRDEGKNVLLVDAGDEIQGDIFGAMDEGETIIKIMEATGYQLATPGNHDFDYGVLRLLRIAEDSDFRYVSCNFHSTDGEETSILKSHIFEIGGKKVAFIGITTPEIITSSTPTYFQNEKGEFIYTVDGVNGADDLYLSVQSAIDEVKDDVDYVIGLGHIGVEMDNIKRGWDSKSVIKNVSGLNAFIDGHSHTTMEGDIVKDKDGNDVILTQAGYYLNNIGVMTISADGTITTKLVSEYDREDEQVAEMEKAWMDEIDAEMSEKIGVLEKKLYTQNPDNEKQRLIRAKELNLGDFTADSMYWFFNERLQMDCDIAFQNGGGIRSQIETGDLTYLSAKQVAPFGNMVCLISATGQQIVDALEMGANEIGIWDEEWDAPAENGGFLQVAGMKYTIDSTIPTSVEIDENRMFLRVNGEYKVRDVEIYNRETKEYEPIDLNKKYQVGGINYILRNSGNGLSMFSDDELTIDYVGQDYIILAEYIKSFASDGDYPLVNTKNSPLSSYEGYLLDYDNPYGSGRINIIME